MEFYVYAHRRKTDGKIFYIGKGCGKRAWKKSTRSDWWKRIEAKHGRTVEILWRGENEAEAFAKEAEIVAAIGLENLCNLRDGGDGGYRPTQEVRERMRRAKLGRKVSPETREKHRLASLGRRHSEETKAKLRAANLGKPGRAHSEETKEKLRLINTGKKMSPEACAKLSAAKKGRPGTPMSDAAKEKLRQASMGRPVSEGAKRKIGDANRGRKHTPEQLAKVTANNQRLNAARRKPITCSNGMVFSYSGDAELWLKGNGFPTANRSNIVSCCTGRLGSAYGFKWFFADVAGE